MEKMKLVLSNGLELKNIQEQSWELCKVAINENPNAIEFCKYKNEQMCLDVLEKDGLLLRFMEYKTSLMRKIALEQNPRAIIYC